MSTKVPHQFDVTPRPYSQGDLDSLCSIYSTINAFRFACFKAGWRCKISWSVVFGGCLARLASRWPAQDLMTEGLTTYQQRLCITYVRRYLRAIHKIQTHVDWPLAKRKRVDMAVEFEQLRARLNTTSATAILGYESKAEGHSTTIVAITKGHIILADSSGRRKISISRLQFDKDGLWQRNMAYALGPRDLVIITIQPPD